MEPDEPHKSADKVVESAEMESKVKEEDAPDPDEGDLDDLDGGHARPLSSSPLITLKPDDSSGVNRYARRILRYKA